MTYVSVGERNARLTAQLKLANENLSMHDRCRAVAKTLDKSRCETIKNLEKTVELLREQIRVYRNHGDLLATFLSQSAYCGPVTYDPDALSGRYWAAHIPVERLPWFECTVCKNQKRLDVHVDYKQPLELPVGVQFKRMVCKHCAGKT